MMTACCVGCEREVVVRGDTFVFAQYRADGTQSPWAALCEDCQKGIRGCIAEVRDGLLGIRPRPVENIEEEKQ